MTCERYGTVLSITGDHGNGAGRKACLLDQSGKLQHRRRSHFRRFEDDAATSSQSRRQFGCRQKHLRVPRHHCRYHTYWQAQRVNMHVRLVDRQYGTFDLVRQPCVIPVVIRHIAGLRLGLDGQFAAVRRLNGAQMIRVFRDQICQTVKQLAPRSLCHIPPCRVIQHRTRGGHGVVHILWRRAIKGGPDLTRCRVDAFHHLPALARAPLASDKQRIMRHRHRHSYRSGKCRHDVVNETRKRGALAFGAHAAVDPKRKLVIA